MYVAHTRVEFKVFSLCSGKCVLWLLINPKAGGKEKQKLALSSHFSEFLTWCTMCDAVFAAAPPPPPPPWSVLHLPEEKGHMSS